ncbi:helix-turn-helix domain-containing protein [Paenibacillus radicis (ex Xue et al. 2023)]|uniref:Helix-turn-helix transcriptional regulator n=1 Tax=Paenibacillus radicis (ex Xue et al. 2023) TaxID=2972489 RepID=A0ABT1YUF6_9BACL|nr:helix-turn-helix transcriptional regulator [Paenibacillus radicis (ex Xue et al. 2023)]MCR8635775.1 helix-turn-helix transcriptional regulator [Paenibacillus radicis (ex Xue et al. 2023)]
MAKVNDRIKSRRLAMNLTLLDVADFLGVKEATAQRYESGDIKNIKHETIVSLAELFKCSPAYLMGWEDEVKNTSTLTPKEERDIAKDLEQIMSDLESESALAFHGEVMDEEDRELLRRSLENSLIIARQMAKKKFTPKKYQK